MLKALVSAVALALVAAAPASAQDQTKAQTVKTSAASKVSFNESHIESLKAALQLSAEQEALWPAVEAALRDYIKSHGEVTGSVQRLGSKASAAYNQAASIGRVIVAARPLVKTLSPEQKEAALGIAQSAGLSHLAAAL
jgi:hypothetical protein